MRKSMWTAKSARTIRQIQQTSGVRWLPLRGGIHVSAAPTTKPWEKPYSDIFPNPSDDDASFEVLGAPHSILSVSLSASQSLFTRRGTLIGISGKVENTRSRLSIIEPFRRSLLRIPFLYEKISSTCPITVLISTKSAFLTSFTVLDLNGTVDWLITKPSSLIAWTGHSLIISPTTNRTMGLAHMGNIKIFGRGLIALAGRGNVYQISLQPGEEYLVHPSNVIAHTISPLQNQPPQLYSFPSESLFRLNKINGTSLSLIVSNFKYCRLVQQTRAWKILVKILLILRRSISRALWGDGQQFLKFSGPAKILLSSRTVSVSEFLLARHEQIETDIAKTDTIIRDASLLNKNQNSVLSGSTEV